MFSRSLSSSPAIPQLVVVLQDLFGPHGLQRVQWYPWHDVLTLTWDTGYVQHVNAADDSFPALVERIADHRRAFDPECRRREDHADIEPAYSRRDL